MTAYSAKDMAMLLSVSRYDSIPKIRIYSEEKVNHEIETQPVVIGRNPVLEAFRSGKEIDTLYVAKGERQGIINKIIAMARTQNVVVKEVNTQKLDSLSGGAAHQGVAAVLCCEAYATVEDILARAEEKGEPPFLILADEIEDPHNLGALIRTAEAAGAHGMIIPKRRSASLTSIVYKTSAGAVSHLPVARVANLPAVMEELKQKNIWFYAADMEGEDWCAVDYSGGVGLVVGSEGNGLGRLVKEKCDFFVSLPMRGKVTSLNASVAGGILMYEIARQRMRLKAK